MLNIKTLIATVLLSSVAALSFAQAPAAANDAGATAPVAKTTHKVKKAAVKKHTVKKAHKARAVKKAAPVAPAAQ